MITSAEELCSVSSKSLLYVTFQHKWSVNPLSPHDASFCIPVNRLNFPRTKDLRMQISMKLVYQYMVIFLHF